MQLAYDNAGKLCAWFTHAIQLKLYKQVACDSFRQKLCSLNRALTLGIKLFSWLLYIYKYRYNIKVLKKSHRVNIIYK
jgi:hypothetical protein